MFRRPARSLAIGVAALVALPLAACSSDDAASSSADTATATIAAAAPTSTTTSTAPEPATRSWIANVLPTVRQVIVHESPNGPHLHLDTSGTGGFVPVVIPNPLPSGAPTTFHIERRTVAAADGSLWHEVDLPVRPNGSTGWISADDVTLTHTDMSAVISLSAHTLTLSDGDAVLATYPVAVGAAPTPTPTGRFFVKELVEPPNRNGAYGPLAYGLTAHSDALIDTEAFADGVIGMHGTNQPSLIGTDVSHGCVRLRNADVLDLQKRQVPLGMPVTITA
ncbi:MAG: L,D-transpeptidase [Acidimicrobiales bacterium]